MIELYLSKVTESSETEQAGKLYARVSYKQAMTIQDMARHMAEHNTVFSEGSILGVLTDFVKCVREMVLMGNTVKIENVATASIGTLAEGQKTGAAVKTVKLLAQSTGDFTRDELKKDVRLAWTDKTKAEIAAAKGGETTSGGGTNQGGSGENTGGNSGGNNNGGGTLVDDPDGD